LLHNKTAQLDEVLQKHHNRAGMNARSKR
jgi:hypothetical protein